MSKSGIKYKLTARTECWKSNLKLRYYTECKNEFFFRNYAYLMFNDKVKSQFIRKAKSIFKIIDERKR